MDHDLQDEISESEADTSASSEDVSEEETSWINWFCSIRGNEFFCEVEEDWIQDEFNLTGLQAEVPYFDYALDTILDTDSPNADLLTEEQQETVDAAAELLYGLIHARYILTSKGLSAMFDKFQDVAFGRCGRIFCEGQPLLPVGQSDQPRKFTVAVYCPRCNDIYAPKSNRHSSIDGAYFGTTFPHLLMMSYPNAIPPAPAGLYTPRIFGFKIHRPGNTADSASSSSAAADGAGVAGAAAAAVQGGTGRPAGAGAGGPGAAASAASSSPAGAAAAGGAARAVGPAGPAQGPEPYRGPSESKRGRRELTTVLPRDASGRPIGRDGRTLIGGDDFFDEEDAEAERDNDAAVSVSGAGISGTGGTYGTEHDSFGAGADGEGLGDGLSQGPGGDGLDGLDGASGHTHGAWTAAAAQADGPGGDVHGGHYGYGKRGDGGYQDYPHSSGVGKGVGNRYAHVRVEQLPDDQQQQFAAGMEGITTSMRRMKT